MIKKHTENVKKKAKWIRHSFLLAAANELLIALKSKRPNSNNRDEEHWRPKKYKNSTFQILSKFIYICLGYKKLIASIDLERYDILSIVWVCLGCDQILNYRKYH